MNVNTVNPINKYDPTESVLSSSDVTLEHQSVSFKLSSSSQKILQKIDSWLICKKPIMARFKQQLQHIDAMKAELELLVVNDNKAKFEEIFRALYMEVDSVRYHTLNHLCFVNNQSVAPIEPLYRVSYLTNNVSTGDVLQPKSETAGWELLNIGIGSFYDICVHLGEQISLIQVEYIAMVEHDGSNVRVRLMDSNLYVFDGAEHIVDNVYQLANDACLIVPRFEEPKDGLSIQMSYRVLKRR